jgi:hypothetical protein
MYDGPPGQAEGFFTDTALDAGAGARAYRRLPGDELPYPEEEDLEDPGTCFACTYVPSGTETAEAGGGMRNVYLEMMSIITKQYGKTSNRILVEMVHEFYTSQIKMFYNYPIWSKRCIWEHIHVHMHDDHVQTSETIRIINRAMDLCQAGMCYTEAGRVILDHAGVKLFLEMGSKREILMTSRLKRRAM